MNFEEYPAKVLLASMGIPVPHGRLVAGPAEAEAAATDIGPCVVKAQVPTGKRGNAGGVKIARSPVEASGHAEKIIGMKIGDYVVEQVLVEAFTPHSRELYASIVSDNESCSPILLFSAEGGVDIEKNVARHERSLRRVVIDIRQGLGMDQALQVTQDLNLAGAEQDVAEFLLKLYQAYRKYDCELVEINPLVITDDGRVVALDCKLVLDDSAAPRQKEIAGNARPETQTELELEASEKHLKYIQLDGSVGILANGAGLTMTTMDVVAQLGGRPANFLEIGGEAYTLARDAIGILLKHPGIRSILVNFCGAFARTDVMAEGVIEAWKALRPKIPIFFTVHGTGEERAISLIEEAFGVRPFDLMDDAVRAAVEAARVTA